MSNDQPAAVQTEEVSMAADGNGGDLTASIQKFVQLRLKRRFHMRYSL